MNENRFYYLKLVKFDDEEYFITDDYDFMITPMSHPKGLKIFDDLDEAIEYKQNFITEVKKRLNLRLSWDDVKIINM